MFFVYTNNQFQLVFAGSPRKLVEINVLGTALKYLNKIGVGLTIGELSEVSNYCIWPEDILVSQKLLIPPDNIIKLMKNGSFAFALVCSFFFAYI
jgi:hypothetical protein